MIETMYQEILINQGFSGGAISNHPQHAKVDGKKKALVYLGPSVSKQTKKDANAAHPWMDEILNHTSAH